MKTLVVVKRIFILFSFVQATFGCAEVAYAGDITDRHCHIFTLESVSTSWPTGQDAMNCKVVFFFTAKCKGVASDGCRWSWNDYGITTVPLAKKRCQDVTVPSGPKIARIRWWHGKDFKKEAHNRDLYQAELGECRKLKHNDAMKSIKFWGKPGQVLEIYDNPRCKKDDDWGAITFPTSGSVVELPRIGRQGESKVRPRGAYKFHYYNGLPGKVSAIKLH